MHVPLQAQKDWAGQASGELQDDQKSFDRGSGEVTECPACLYASRDRGEFDRLPEMHRG
jgi:hypothetical protein